MRWLSALALLLIALTATAQSGVSLLPLGEGDRVRFNAVIETERAAITGICAMLREGDMVKASLFNEFGITALDFTYDVKKRKVKLHTVLPMLNKWYIRHTLRGDLKHLMQALDSGETGYANTRRHITYQFTPIVPLEDLGDNTENNDD